MQILEVAECLRPDDGLATWKLEIVPPCNDTSFAADWQHCVLAIHLLQVGVDGKLVSATNGAVQSIRRVFLYVYAAQRCHQHAGDELIVEFDADKLTRYSEG